MNKARHLVLLGLFSLLLVIATHSPVSAQQTDTPNLVCPAGYTLQETLDGDLLRAVQGGPDLISHNFSLATTSQVSLVVWSMVGHPDTGYCALGAGNDPGEYPCDQTDQLDEEFYINVDGSGVAFVPDHGTDQWLLYNSNLALGTLSAGSHTIAFQHSNESTNDTAESVRYRVGVCVLSVPPTATPTDTPTNTPVIPTATPTDTPTNTPVIPTSTPTDTPTNTPVIPTATPTDTPTNTPVPPTATPTNTPTNTPVIPTATPTNTPTNTPVPPTATPTNTPTNTPVVPTSTPTNTPTNTPVPRGGEGCTPGYWKQSQHFDSWTIANQDFDAAFVLAGNPTGNQTLLTALNASGGGVNALLRHAAAALLNASAYPGVDYYYTTAQVIALVQGAFASGNYESVKNLLEAQNQAGCSLN